uniref:Uncharacterized protein n=1 Tax=Tanacetum cinerariifolium TaxID=118510 RepID=A0A6L2NTL8_TANCI|nr:hypothetical protein [Tanacetum cinerariifolium]
MELRNNAYNGREEEDVVDHIAWDDKDEGPDYLGFIIWLNSKCNNHKSMDETTKTALWHYWLQQEEDNELMGDIVSSDEEWEESDYENPPNADTNSFFKPYFDAQWIDEGNDKITTWTEAIGRFFYKHYLISRTGKYNVAWDDKDEGPDYLGFIIWLNSKCNNHKSMDETTKTALWHYWLQQEEDNELMGDIVSSDEEWKESDYENPPNADTNSFFKLYFDAQVKNIKKEDERNQKSHETNIIELGNVVINKTPDSDNIKDDQLNEMVSKSEKFKVIKYSLGPDDEYIAINTCKCNAWTRNEYSVSHIYQEIF